MTTPVPDPPSRRLTQTVGGTVAGFLMAQLGRLAVEGDSVDFEGHRIVVRDVENRRVGRVLVTAVPPEIVPDPEVATLQPEHDQATRDDKAS